MVIVREIQVGEEGRWDEYVRNCPYSTPQHLYAWKNVMEDVFHSETHYILTEEDGKITGALPLIHIKSVLSGHYVTSLPGGICTDDEAAAKLLFEQAREFAVVQRARYLILRDSRKKWELQDVVTDDEHVTFLVEIHPNLDQIKNNMKAKTRQLVNKTTNDGLTAAFGLKKLNAYYPIYSKSMRELGTPTLGLDFFMSVSAHLPRVTDLVTLYYGNTVVGGGFLAPFKNMVYCLWSGLLHEHYDLHTAYLLSWEAIKYAHDNEYQWVDLGRCRKNTGGYEFKKKFGGQVQPLYQQIYLNGIGKAPNVGAAQTASLKYRHFIKVWRNLPLPITEYLGPLLRKQMPFG